LQAPCKACRFAWNTLRIEGQIIMQFSGDRDLQSPTFTIKSVPSRQCKNFKALVYSSSVHSIVLQGHVGTMVGIIRQSRLKWGFLLALVVGVPGCSGDVSRFHDTSYARADIAVTGSIRPQPQGPPAVSAPLPSAQQVPIARKLASPSPDIIRAGGGKGRASLAAPPKTTSKGSVLPLGNSGSSKLEVSPAGASDNNPNSVKPSGRAEEAEDVANTRGAGTAPKFRWPARGRVIVGFGASLSGVRNDGINLALPEGTAVKAAEEGVVTYANNELKSHGNLLLIQHSDGYVTVYAHASELLVKRGDQIKRGQVIARSGQTGNVNAPQLHFEVRKGTTPLDPMRFLKG
jgi:hypothetical protein